MVIAKLERIIPIYQQHLQFTSTSAFYLKSGLYTIKYIYGPATVSEDNHSVIGSSIQGRVEAAIGIDRLTTIIMPMKGESTFSTQNASLN